MEQVKQPLSHSDIIPLLIKDKMRGLLFSKKTIISPGIYKIDTYWVMGVRVYKRITVWTEQIPD